jgi:hypothetical protein
MTRATATFLAIVALSAGAHAQDAEGPAPVELPAPTLEEAEPVAPPEPMPEPPEEEGEPQILLRIGPGDHPEWEGSEPAPRDIAFETPGDLRTTEDLRQRSAGLRLESADEEPDEPPLPPFVLAAGAGYSRFLSTVPIDFFRVEERFEVTIPELSLLRVGAAASQMFGANGYLVGGGVRIGLGVPFCRAGDLVCDGAAFVQPGFLAGLIGARFDLDALLSLRLILVRTVQVAVEGGYSLLFDGNSLLHVTGSAGFVF